MSIQNAYTNWATTYDTDRNLTRDLDGQITRRMLGDTHYDTILELGCGTGKNTVFLAEVGQHVTALDFSEGMLAQAQAKVQRDNVTFSQADLTQPWPCVDSDFDIVVTNLVLEHIENLDFIFGQAHRVLKSGGIFFISELHPSRQYLGGKATFQRGEEPTFIDAYVHHISQFMGAAKDVGFIMQGFNECWHDDDDPRLFPRLANFVFAK